MNELEQLRTRASRWTLADDSKLITVLSSLVESMIDRGRSLDASLSSTSSAVSRLHSQLDTAESAIGLYSGTHFIEQRVLDDDYRPRKPTVQEPPLTLQQRQSIIVGELRQAVNDGLNVIETCFRPLGDEDDPLRQYEPVDRYNRSIPPLIGSAAFHAMGKKKEEPTREVTITIDRPSNVGEVRYYDISASVPSPSSSSSQFIGISAYPPSSSAPPPPPPMPSKLSPTPSTGQSALQAEITSVLDRARGEFRVPHDKGPEDVDAGLTPPLPPRSVHPTQAPLAPILPPRGSVQHATPPELPPKIADKPSTSSSVLLPAEPKKKSIFDFDSDDDDFAAVLSRPSGTKTAASSSTLSSSMRSNESDTKSSKSQEEKKENDAKPAPPSLVSELAAAAASKRAQQLAAASAARPPSRPPRSSDGTKKVESTPISSSMPPPLATSTPAVKKEEKKEEEIKTAPKKQPIQLQAPWAPKKSIFDDEDSDFDELFKPAAKKTINVVKNEEKKEEMKREEPKKIEEAPKPVPVTSKPPEKPRRKNIFDDDSDFEDLFKPKVTQSQKFPQKTAL
ncbi:hypothetical protein PFISCL1PPCAC_26864 [Pristionchus fissidentatus]|uniref:WASH1 WAHD domain-containing protein n=1 Tax=Pristionchus fissidentatus TaxID=1538716 RepID=A0AAV5WX20_9BILA|nr:hypothetical protein PFISCL1PPCAC_26864 [Pristionchus fissidentatus]